MGALVILHIRNLLQNMTTHERFSRHSHHNKQLETEVNVDDEDEQFEKLRLLDENLETSL